MNLNSDDHYSYSEPDKRKGFPPSPTKQGANDLSQMRDDSNQEAATDNYIEEMKKGTSNILVAVRMRPLWNKEIEKDEFEVVKILDQKVVILMDPADIMNENVVLGKNRSKEKQYAFDFAFDKDTTQLEIFSKTTKFLCDGVLNGYNATVFAYGPTGAGKTYTMLGTELNPGIMFNTMKELFIKIKEYKIDREYNIRVSFLEIYNEQIRDLIMVSSDVLDLREDPVKGVCVAGLSEIKVDTPEEILQLLIFGNRNRTCEATGANETSSRSHAVLQVICEHKDKDAGIEAEMRIGKLSLIDLAGSERASKTNNRGIRMIEGANINRSLLALGNCINALHENNSKNQSNYIPFRDSKLTRLLKDSLGGNCRTVMIANISPSNACFEDTHNTLKYANRAKNIKTNVQRNVLNVEYHVSKYTQIIAQLRGEISDLKTQLRNAGGGNGSQLALPREPQVNMAELERFKDELNNHFSEEIRTKKRLNELEQKLETSAMGLMTKKNELGILLRDKANADNIQVKVINEEIDETNNQLRDLKIELEKNSQKMSLLLKRRESFTQDWKSAGLREIGFEVLNHILRENIVLLENMDVQRKEQKADLQLKMREMQLTKMQEQIRIRDELLMGARKRYQQEGIDHDLDDPRLISLQELISSQQSILPPINNNSMGKATGTLIKNLLSNLSVGHERQGASNGGINLNNQRKNQNQNNIYHSLPPIGPNPREQSESKIPKPKYILQSMDPEMLKNRAVNYKESNSNVNKRAQQVSYNSRLASYGTGNQSNQQTNVKNTPNINKESSNQQSNKNLPHTNGSQSNPQLGAGTSNQNSTGHLQTNISNIKQQINFASNFAKNLQFQSKLRKPTFSLNQRQGESSVVKNSLNPSPSQMQIIVSNPAGNPVSVSHVEERKRASSVHSSGSIISTASSNSPKLLEKKRIANHISLQIAGTGVNGPLGSQRKSYIPSKYDKSPMLGNGKQSSSNNLISVTNQGNSAGAQSQPRSIALSMAARKKEMQQQAEHSAQMLEKNKKKVLDALNKNYRKK